MKYVLIVILSLFLFLNLRGQEKKTDSLEMQYMRFRDSISNNYSQFLSQKWEEFKAFESGRTFKVPKPKVVPTIKIIDRNKKPKPIFTKTLVPEEIVFDIPQDDFLWKRDDGFRIRLLEFYRNKNYHKEINYFGIMFNFHYDNIDFELNEITAKSVNKIFKYLYKKDKELNDAIYQWRNYANIMKLNDYGLIQIIRKTLKQIYQDELKVKVALWFIMSKMNYDCRLGFNDNDFFVFINTKTKINHTVYIKINKKTYYALVFNPEEEKIIKQTRNIMSYRKIPFEAKHIFDLSIKNIPSISPKFINNIFLLNKKYSDDKLEIKYNINYIDFLKELPILDYHYYFNMPVSVKTMEDIRIKLRPFIQDKTDLEAVNFLLNFVQYSFPYKFDKDNFGRVERPQSPEEMLHYKYSDCEDHSALFAYLVNLLIGAKVIGILYEDHVATAVCLGKGINGYHLPHPYEEYIICDPTYIGAGVGDCIPKYIGVKPEKIFKINKN